ncbi:MAG TPA: hypothetical protein VHX17_13545 [Candidatus Cybelea sp.]|jgi:hypothetical protein|nr:hypothetical protein [Candidatus Cybelea sp.]
MPFRSILFLDASDSEDVLEPPYFRDLNLDQIFDAVAARETEFDLRPLFTRALANADAIRYRQEAVRDLQRSSLAPLVHAFCNGMHVMREQLAQRTKLHDNLQNIRWLLDAVETYCCTIGEFATGLSQIDVESRAFVGFRSFLKAYVGSSPFQSLLKQSQRLRLQLAGIRYGVLVGSGFVSVRPYDEQPNYSAEVAATFEKFRRGSAKDYRVAFNERAQMNYVEEQVLGFVADLHPQVFDELRMFAETNEVFSEPLVMRFDLEVRFYVAYLDHISPLKKAGLPFCFPELAIEDKNVYAYEAFDLALAQKLTTQLEPIVLNDFALGGAERVFLVSGPNQGGKTTFARTFGQLHYLACLGVPVPGSRARLFVFDKMFTHFDRNESIETLRGKLQDDLVRIRRIFELATPRTILILNEIFSSTTLADAMFLGRKILERIVALDALCVCVTFLVDLAARGPTIVSLVSEVLVEQPNVRTFRIVRAPADGRSYAQSIAEKYRLTYDLLKHRIGS